MPAESTGTLRVYCAGPLFNQSERSEMTAIADVLCENGYQVYLPHRDGMEFRLVHDVLIERDWPAATAAAFLHAAIFALDVFQLARACDAMVWNLNGRTPDEGAVAEAAIAWTLGKPLVAYCDDVRSLISGRMNPLLVGMVDFQTVEEIEAIPRAMAEALVKATPQQDAPGRLPPRLQRAVEEGGQLWRAMTDRSDEPDDERIADVVTELFAPPVVKS